jgi:hypothetical protein
MKSEIPAKKAEKININNIAKLKNRIMKSPQISITQSPEALQPFPQCRTSHKRALDAGNWKPANGWRMMTLGIWHGLLGRTGQYREA